PALQEPLVIGQRCANLAGTDNDHRPVVLQPQYFTQAAGQLTHRVAQPALAERSKERQVLPHLRRRGATTMGQLIAGCCLAPLSVELLEVAKIGGKSAYS